jgi:hypothetical protein
VTCKVSLVGFPVELGLRARQQSEALLREFAIIAMGGGERADVPKRLLEIAAESDDRYAITTRATHDIVDLAHARGDASVDFDLELPDRIAADTAETVNVLLEVDQYCSSGELLTLNPTPEIKLFWIWFLGELVRQISGMQPTSWPEFSKRFDF